MEKLRRAGSSKEGQFNIEELRYPDDLYSDAKKHMVVFFINVPGHSKIGESLSASETSDFVPQIKSSGTSKVSGGLNDMGIKSTDISGMKLTIAPGYKQLKAAIALYMPNDWKELYSAKYEQAETSGITNLLLDSMNRANSQGTSLTKEIAASMGQRLFTGTIGAALSAISGGGELAGNKIMGKMKNPNAEQIFNGMDFRSFEFSWKMAPKNRAEADNILRIINTFKYHMHPELSNDNYLIFPAEFEIEFYSGGNVNQFVGSLSTCALKSLNVNYTPNNFWSAFKGTDGYPTSIELSLTFDELEPLTKDKLKEWGEHPDAVSSGSSGNAASAADTVSTANAQNTYIKNSTTGLVTQTSDLLKSTVASATEESTVPTGYNNEND